MITFLSRVRVNQTQTRLKPQFMEAAMKFLVVLVLVSSLVLLGPVAARAETDRIDAATQILDQMPGQIPAFVLNHAKGIAVIPGEVKAGFIFGGEVGGGVLVRRLPKGGWSTPALISIAGGTFGFQIGGEVRDIVLVLNSSRSVDLIENGTLNLGGDASIVAGPVGGDYAVTTQSPDVYSYVRSFGAFAGATVGGSALSMDLNANRSLYGVSDPLRVRPVTVPASSKRFTCAVSRATGVRSKACS
jgi:lipid-binding SYLF domain-containing protein